VAGEVLLRKGHIERDCLRRASIATCCNASEGARCEYSLNGTKKEVLCQTSMTKISMRSETCIPDEASRIRCDDPMEKDTTAESQPETA
jgi:hypothetical protein